MKYVNAIALGTAALLVAGCASTSKVVLQDRVGPCNRTVAHDTSDGFLQVYSARERAPIDLNTQEFFWNSDYGRNEFLYTSAHTGYTILDEEGAVVQRVRNARDLNDTTPALVKLPTGDYTVEAEAEDSGGITVTILVPLVVESGQITAVHLEPAWKRPAEPESSGHVVALADGRIIGCRAEHVIGQKTQPATVVAHN